MHNLFEQMIELRRSEYWMRFELGGEKFSNDEQSVLRFLQAFERTSKIFETLFTDPNRVSVLIAYENTDPQYASGGAFELRELGVDISAADEFWTGKYNPLEEDSHDAHWCAFNQLNLQPRNALIWGRIADEMPISPSTGCQIYFLDCEAKILINVYDDRGLDVFGGAKESLIQLYRKLSPWLLDYNRDYFDQTFGS